MCHKRYWGGFVLGWGGIVWGDWDGLALNDSFKLRLVWHRIGIGVASYGDWCGIVWGLVWHRIGVGVASY